MVWAIGLALASGCFSDSGGIGDYTTTVAASTGSGTAPTSTGGDTGTGTSTSTSEVGNGSTASASEATGSTTSTTSTTSATGGEGDACDPWAQDCAAGLKCAPYASDGGDAWNANKCTPVGEGVAGGPCIAMMSATSGYDTCEQGAICWDVDPATLAGVCYAMCKGSPNTPICPPNSACSMNNEGVVNVCLGTCDPLLPKCAGGQVCVPDGADQFLCVASAGALPLYSPCTYLNECTEGTMCASSLPTTKCNDKEPRCCTAYCNVEVPVCKDALTCVPYFPMGTAPMGLENVGLCQDGP